MAAASTDRRASAAVRPFKRARLSRPPAHWERTDCAARPDVQLKHWQKASTQPVSFSKYDVEPSVPNYDDETYEKHLADPNWTKDETQYLVDTYRQCSGKWPVIIDRYEAPDRTMEDLKMRFYQISATLLQIATPISSMTTPEYSMYETLTKFNPSQEASRKRLAEGHLLRRQNEVDEEAVLLAELQRIMANQKSLEESRDELRVRLDYPHANSNSYQYSSSQALSTLWQQLLSADRMRKNQRLRQAGPQSAGPIEGAGTGPTPTSARPRESNAGMNHDQPASSYTRLSDKDQVRFGVTHAAPGEKLPGGVTFASDRLSKPRTAKSNAQTEKIASILSSIGVPDLIPLPTSAVIQQFEAIMTKVHTLLDMRKLAEKEEQELRVREAEAAALDT